MKLEVIIIILISLLSLLTCCIYVNPLFQVGEKKNPPIIKLYY